MQVTVPLKSLEAAGKIAKVGKILSCKLFGYRLVTGKYSGLLFLTRAIAESNPE